MKRNLLVSGLAATFALGTAALVGCEKKSTEQKAAEVSREANKDVGEERQEAAKDVAEIRADEREDLNDVQAGAAGDRQEAANEAVEQTRDSYVESADRTLKALEGRKDTLEDKVDGLSGTAKSAFDAPMADVNAKREGVDQQMKALKDADSTSWTPLKSSFEKAVADYQSAITTAEQSIKM